MMSSDSELLFTMVAAPVVVSTVSVGTTSSESCRMLPFPPATVLVRNAVPCGVATAEESMAKPPPEIEAPSRRSQVVPIVGE